MKKEVNGGAAAAGKDKAGLLAEAGPSTKPGRAWGGGQGPGGVETVQRVWRGRGEDATTGVGAPGPTSTQTFGSVCDWRLTKR